ncbi:MAG TPA: gephyrin-like molybdotransferase Glp [Burkholderiaceae bacterium]|nr:gephyrin-like molybdotransferase Glp [Burkholderiaceae bacterium]
MKTLHDVVSCLSDYDPHALSVAQAQDIIARCVEPVVAIEKVALRAALGRVLAADVVSPIDVPAHDNSAMDGYAFAGRALRPDEPIALKIVGSAFAGAPCSSSVNAGECVRIMTGAVMPDGCDTVAPQEFCDVDGDRVVIPPSIKPGDNRRLRGEDLAVGKPAIEAGRVIRPAELGLAASLGLAELPVRRRLRVAFFSTGDELRSLGETLGPGEVYDSNRYTLYGMLERLGCEPLDFGVVRDDPVALREAFRAAANCADAVITSGGVSVGEADHTKQIMAALGDVVFWTIAMRPGRPMAFGRVGGEHGAVLFGLPGNPVAVMVTFYFFVRDALLRMQGAAPSPLALLQARSADAIRKKPGRTEYQRGVLAQDADDGWSVRLTGQQGSGVLKSMSSGNCFVVLGHRQGPVAAGSMVDVLPFEGLV